MLALILGSIDTAKVCYLIACILLAIIGVLMCVLDKAYLTGLAWIGVAIIALGLWNSITP